MAYLTLFDFLTVLKDDIYLNVFDAETNKLLLCSKVKSILKENLASDLGYCEIKSVKRENNTNKSKINICIFLEANM